MKTKLNTLLSRGGQRLAFILVCLLIAGAGWTASLALEDFSRQQDQIQSAFSGPSQVYLWHERQKQHAQPALAPKLEQPVNPALRVVPVSPTELE